MYKSTFLAWHSCMNEARGDEKAHARTYMVGSSYDLIRSDIRDLATKSFFVEEFASVP
jgi:hypothetical protein